MFRSTVFLLLLLAVVAADGTSVDHLKEACAKTPHQKLCVTILSADPESETADARGLALLAIRAAAKMAAAASAASDAEEKIAEDVNIHEGNDCTAAAKASLCFSYCGAGFKVAVWMFTNATDDAVRLLTARFYFQLDRVQPYRAWDCRRCHVVGVGRTLPGVLAKGSDTEKFMEVTSTLVRLAPGGTDPLPPLPDNVYAFLNWIDEGYVHMPDDCPAKEPKPPKPPTM